MLKKFLCLSVVGCLGLWACSGDSTSAGSTEDSMIHNVAKSDSNAILKFALWSSLDSMGIPGYFKAASEKGIYVYDPYTRDNLRCPAPALAMDDNTLFFDELETIYQEGELVDGVCGKAVSLADGQVAPLGVNLIDSMKVGTVEFWFHPGKEFYDKPARTLLGNDGARIHFFYKDGELIFQKNHHNQHFFVKNMIALDSGWNLIAGQWGDGYMSLWLNGKLVAKKEHDLGYAPAMRGIPFENLFVIGYKSKCCMEGVDQYQGMTTAGAFDQFRISNVTRYDVQAPVVVVDSLPPAADPAGENEESEDELDSLSEGQCSTGIDMSTDLDSLDNNVVHLKLVTETVCPPDYELVIDSNAYDKFTYSLYLRDGSVVKELLPVGSVYYGCIDLTDFHDPKFNASACTGLVPGTYRLYIAYEGKRNYYAFKVQGEIDE